MDTSVRDLLFFVFATFLLVAAVHVWEKGHGFDQMGEALQEALAENDVLKARLKCRKLPDRRPGEPVNAIRPRCLNGKGGDL